MVRRFLLLLIITVLHGCATLDHPADPNDPLERYNRAVYNFNDTFDQYLLKPVAKGYDKVTPDPVQKGINNFFSNLDDIIVIVNDLLQLKPGQMLADSGRFVINSSLGLFGFIDWASDIGLEKHNEDFGQTLGAWGVAPGPYFMLPFLGPSTIRDTGGLATDSYYFDLQIRELENGFPPPPRRPESQAWNMTILDAIDTRAKLLKSEKILDEAALDPYVFLREAWLQRRNYLVKDGNVPKADDEMSEEELFGE
ncbi:MAG: phospholipid-binding lipoprotein MlaA [Pseudomonadota bacterium]|nr:phospholipid-binding lipoprotein MlaA [Pseudomonadota bacterium]